MSQNTVKQYVIVTASYWGFTLTDGALRMLVVLHFFQLGYSSTAIASLFLFYELFGVVTNLGGGWLAAKTGLKLTLNLGLLLQTAALMMLLIDTSLLSFGYVMLAQAVSGIAKDLNKMSAKSSVKLFAANDSGSQLYRWIAWLTGSKNALKGVGFFLGSLLLSLCGFRGSILALLIFIAIIFAASLALLSDEIGKSKGAKSFQQLFSASDAINRLSAARFFLFGARDIWFVVALPVYLQASLAWTNTQVGAFMALWIIAYGAVQALAPAISPLGKSSIIRSLLYWKMALAIIPLAIAVAVSTVFFIQFNVVAGIFAFGAVFAMTSAIHSFLIVAYARNDSLATDVGFYYMCNAGGRLVGAILSGVIYQYQGLVGCLLASASFVLLSLLMTRQLPPPQLNE